MTRIREFDIAYSLGHACGAAFQLRRVFGEANCPTGVFDWQKTPRSARRHYFRQNFSGLFERNDLKVGKDGVVTHKFLGTSHIHEFPSGTTEATLDDGYANARSRHDHLTTRMREHFNSNDLRLLLCVSRRHSLLQYLHLLADLQTNFPRLRFWLVNAPVDETDDWRGTDTAWNATLARYRPTGVAKAASERIMLGLSENVQAGVRKPSSGLHDDTRTAERSVH